MNSFWNYVEDNNIKLSPLNIINKLKHKDFYKKISKYTDNDLMKMIIFKLLHPTLFQTKMLGKNNPKKIFETPKIDPKHIIFMIMNSNNYTRIINYVSNIES